MNGLLLPHIPFSALKENGVGSFGGREGKTAILQLANNHLLQF